MSDESKPDSLHDEPEGAPAPAPAEEQEKEADASLPSFLVNPGKVDKILLGLLAFMTVYSMVMIPLRPNLLVNAPWLLSIITGSGLGILITAAQNQGAIAMLAGLTAVAAASSIKFAMVYFFMGKHWGQDFISWIFANHTPLWYRKLERFVEKHLYFTLLLGFIPFSPIPVAILVAIAGIRKLNAWATAGYIYLLAVGNKIFYLYLGLQFGEGIRPTLETIDRYMMQITLVLVAYVFIVNWWRASKNQKAKKQ
ncbi:DedA family protein [Rothia nasimurium]|uniref:DedA family protein n=1 Tax=Rothia nasimurium TaxID=85336 RepID=UPI0009F4FFA2|nr:hypothetical protein [Rothia nasimurium]